MLKIQKVGKLLVKWDDDLPFGTPFVTVNKKELIIDIAIKVFDNIEDSLEVSIAKAVEWANNNQ